MPRQLLTRSNSRILALSLLAVGVLVLCTLTLAAQESPSPEPTVRQAVGFAVSPPLRDLAKLPRSPQYGVHEALPVRRIPKGDFGIAVDPVEQNAARPSTNFTIGLDFLGVGNGFPGYTVPDAPPDTNMAVGDTQILQWVNVSFAVFNKFNPAIVTGPIEGNLLFSALGGPCANNNNGDIIAQWDNAAHQWFLAQNVFNGPPYYACVAISTTADALGTYYLYQFSLGNGFPDYPKWGRWNNNWAQTMNNFGPGGSGFVGPEVCVYNRAKLLLGQSGPPAIQVCFQLAPDGDSLLPADIDSSTNPPAGEDQFFIGSVADVNNSHLSLYSVDVDWRHPSGATITGNHNSQLILVPTYTGPCSGAFGGDCVPQKGITDKLDSLGDRLMYRFAYFDDAAPGGYQHWYVNHSVEASAGQIGVRWYEFQAPKISIPPLGLTLFQSGTYAPDSNYRWMGSIAGDINNDVLAGYSVSSSSVYPSIAIAGRLKTDPRGTLEPELSVVAGTGSQPDTANRWGDYSAMRIDPDGCTFWYTTEYYMLTASFDWSTQIASARFATCQNPAADGYIELCKQTDPDFPVPGTFNFNLTAGPFFSAGPYAVPVGSCSPPIQVPSGIVTINEAPQIGVGVENVTAYSDGPFGQVNELDSWTFPDQTATVTVVPGDVSLETVATYTNYAAPPGTLKICKIAGPGITVGTIFRFMLLGSPQIYNVPAGPPPGGSCQIIGTFPVNTRLTVAEMVPPGVVVSNITVEPPNRGGQQTSNSVVVTIGNGVTEADFTDSSSQACAGQSLITIDPVHNYGYVPIYQLDPITHDSQLAVVDLSVTNTHVIKKISLPGASRPLAAAYNPGNQTMLVEAFSSSAGIVYVYIIDATTQTLTTRIAATGLDFVGEGGGIFSDNVNNRALVAGRTTLGILNGINGASPTWNAASVISLSPAYTDSISFNPVTDIVFIAADGTNATVSAPPGSPLVLSSFESDFGLTDGNAFDPFTNILSLSPEFEPSLDQSWAFNFATLGGGTANNVVVPDVCLNGGTGCQEVPTLGEGPGGQVAINCSTHQSVVVDEYGPVLKLVHLPPLPVPPGTPLDNNGRPGTGTVPDMASAYTIATTVIPEGNVNGTPTLLGALGDPNSVTIDPSRNFAYMLGDTETQYHQWGGGTSLPLFLVRVDLSNPTVGGSPAGGINGSTYWNLNPTGPSAAIPMPPGP